MFCEVCEQTVVIKNTGYAPLEIEAVYDQTPESELAGVLRKAGWFNVNLSKSGNDFEVRVKYFPGATREFTEKFGLQVNLLHSCLSDLLLSSTVYVSDSILASVQSNYSRARSS